LCAIFGENVLLLHITTHICKLEVFRVVLLFVIFDVVHLLIAGI